MLAAILAPKEGRNNLQVAFAFPESMKILVLPGWDHLALHQYSAVSWDEKNNDDVFYRDHSLDKIFYKSEMKFWAVLGSRGCREKKPPNCHMYATF